MSDDTQKNEQDNDNQQEIRNAASNQGAQGVFHAPVTINNNEPAPGAESQSDSSVYRVEIFTRYNSNKQDLKDIDRSIAWSKHFKETRLRKRTAWQREVQHDLHTISEEMSTRRVSRLELYPSLHSGFGFCVGVHFGLSQIHLTVVQCHREKKEIQEWASDIESTSNSLLTTTPADLDAWLDSLISAPISIELGIVENITESVTHYCQSHPSSPPWQRLHIAPTAGSSDGAIRDNAHAVACAREIRRIIKEIRKRLPTEKIHLFARVPLGLEILIGFELNACGPIQCYGHDKNTNEYYDIYMLRYS